MPGKIVLGHLVHPQRRVVTFHEPRIGMTAAADLRDLTALGFANVSSVGIHRAHPRLSRVPTMTGDAAKSFGRVDVFLKFFHGLAETVVAEGLVAGDAAIDLLLCCGKQRPRRGS
jgi:hypothetical protein